MKRSLKRDEVINDYIKVHGGLSGRVVITAWLRHWHDTHPKLSFDYAYVRIYEKSIVAWGETIQLADPLCFQKLALIITANSKRKRKKR